MATILSERDVPVQLPLGGDLGQRAGDTALGVIAVVGARLLGGLCLTGVVAPQVYGTGGGVGARAFLAVCAAWCLLLGRFGRRSARRGLARDARLTVLPDRIVFRHRGMLREHVEVARADVRAVAIDDCDAERRFAIQAEVRGKGPIAWLWQKPYWRRSIPALVPNAAPPNVAVIFQRPVSFRGRYRHGGWRNWRGPCGPERAVAVRVADADAARRAFAGWDVVRPLVSDDLAAALTRRTRP